MEGRGADLGCLLTHCGECSHLMLLGMDLDDRFLGIKEVEDMQLGLLLGVDEDRL